VCISLYRSVVYNTAQNLMIFPLIHQTIIIALVYTEWEGTLAMAQFWHRMYVKKALSNSISVEHETVSPRTRRGQGSRENTRGVEAETEGATLRRRRGSKIELY